jgi:UDP-glucose 4-epimerase
MQVPQYIPIAKSILLTLDLLEKHGVNRRREMARYVITGGAGFIGSHLTDRIVSEGHQAVVIDNLCTGRKANLRKSIDKIELIEDDICKPGVVEKACRDADAIFHQAALGSVPRSVDAPLETNKTNVEGTLKVLEAARKCKVPKVIYASSSSVYGDRPGASKAENMMPLPKSPYAVSKLSGEYYCRTYADLFGIQTVCLRYFNVFGPRQNSHTNYAAVVPLFVSKLITDDKPVVYGDGQQTRDFTFVQNVVDANLLAARTSGIGGRTFNIATGRKRTIMELLNEIGKHFGYEPGETPCVFDDPRPGDIDHSEADISLATEQLVFSPKIDFSNGIKLTVSWYKNNYDRHK